MENIKHPYADFTLQDALAIARTEAALNQGRFPDHSQTPTPSITEAIKLIEWRLKTCGHNWITGTIALEVLRLANGEKVKFSLIGS